MSHLCETLLQATSVLQASRQCQAFLIVIPAIINTLGGIIFIVGYSIDKHKLSEIMSTLRSRREEKLSNLEPNNLDPNNLEQVM